MRLDIPIRPAVVQRFGNAELDRTAQELRIDGKRAPLGPRAIALLAMLVDERARAVSKHELLDTVWRGVIVEENNLQVQISTLRRLLSPQAIATIPGRGYRFMLPVEGDASERIADAETLPGVVINAARGNLPERLPEIYGRSTECAAVQSLVEKHPLVSIVGAAGIGKTRLALAVARTLAPSFADGVWLIELASLNDPRLLVPTLAQSLHLTLPGLRDPVDELVTALHDQRALLVLDNCETLIDEVDALLARVLTSAPALHVLATSQEPLHVEGEQVYRLGPLAVPEATATGHDAAAYGAVRLFVERVRALLPRFELTEAESAPVVEICRRLDGLPLAIELAAARVPVLGVAGVRDRLGERFRMLTGGSRVAPKRHQTLRAALDWSLGLLDDAERATYRRLGVFVGGFSLESAQELAADDGIASWAVLEHLSSLVDKSLVIAEGDLRPRYRMLESTREHALEQLAAAGETDRWIRRHAETTVQALKREIAQRRTDLVLAEMPNVRSAFDWAYAAGHNAAAVALATLPSMAIAVDGAVQEARDRLLQVESRVDDTLPRELVAQYWQWFGRIGLDGRLPSARCVEAFRRAEALFLEAKNPRHVHACRRQMAEALLDAGDLEGAAEALRLAREMETDRWPLADRMRRLRVEGLWHAESGQHDEALQTSTLALEMAQMASIDRYELVLLDDIARMHLEAGNADEAAARYRALAERARHTPNSGLTLSNAMVGLVAALTAKNDLDEAERVVREALPLLRRTGILLARADILACLMVRRGRLELAAQFLGASDKFRSACGMPRGAMEQRCRDEALQQLSNAAGAKRRAAWLAVGAAASEEALAQAMLEGGPDGEADDAGA
ncbi:MAG TPA: winged helix-turn-helix domain-containing protein [Burkholderiaceae bacterium]|nr:winged helix-turn-helix domain-containing protein [Burkholderiaceae bacterium]